MNQTLLFIRIFPKKKKESFQDRESMSFCMSFWVAPQKVVKVNKETWVKIVKYSGKIKLFDFRMRE